MTLILSQWSTTQPDVKFVLVFASAALGALVWGMFFRSSVPQSWNKTVASGETAAPSAQVDGAGAAVEFSLPSNWGEGFYFRKLEKDPSVGEILAEEVQVRVVAKRKLENVRLEITASELGISGKFEECAQIASSKFAGVVPKGLEQKFVLMRRTFWTTTGRYENALTEPGKTIGTQVRAERNVIFFPENPAAFEGHLGRQYRIRVSVLHDSGQDEASFVIATEPTRSLPQSSIHGRRNIESSKRSKT